MNKFINAAQTGDTYTLNGAASNSTTGSYLLDYFSKAGTYANRTQEEVDLDMVKIFSENKEDALKMVFGLRNITRKTTQNTKKNARAKKTENKFEEVQTGLGRKDEFYKCIVWLSQNHKELLEKNLHLIPVFGCWKDLFTTPLIDVVNRKQLLKVVKNNWDNDLLKKFLPTLRNKPRSGRDSKRIQLVKDIIKTMKISEKEYRAHKKSGNAHVWQKQMSAGEWDKINFNGIPGKAMSIHTGRTGKDSLTVFERHDQVKRLMEWLDKQVSVKFNGYPYELMKPALSNNLFAKTTANKQFESLLELCKGKDFGNVLACLDTSGSMVWANIGNTTAYEICVSMGVTFASMNVGYFKDYAIAFSDHSRLLKLPGKTFSEKVAYIKSQPDFMGSTNFQSVVDLLVKVRKKNSNIPIEEFPETIVVLSDMQWNPTGGYRYSNFDKREIKTNAEVLKQKLGECGLGHIKFIWWHLNGSLNNDFPAKMDDGGFYMISGFDPNNLMSLLGMNKKDKKDKSGDNNTVTPMEGMRNFLSQDIFSLLEF